MDCGLGCPASSGFCGRRESVGNHVATRCTIHLREMFHAVKILENGIGS
jgi:hypothetical protein